MYTLVIIVPPGYQIIAPVLKDHEACCIFKLLENSYLSVILVDQLSCFIENKRAYLIFLNAKKDMFHKALNQRI